MNVVKKQGDSNKTHSKKGKPSNRTNHPNISVQEDLRFAIIAARLKSEGKTILNNTENLQLLSQVFNEEKALEPMNEILSMNEKMLLGGITFPKTFEQTRTFSSMFKIRKTFTENVTEMEENGEPLELALKFVGDTAKKREKIIYAVALSVFYRKFKPDLPTPGKNAGFIDIDEETSANAFEKLIGNSSTQQSSSSSSFPKAVIEADNQSPLPFATMKTAKDKKRERENQNTVIYEAVKKISSYLDAAQAVADTAKLSNMVGITMAHGDEEMKKKAMKKLKEFWDNA